MPQIRIIQELCKKCGMCVEICPEELFSRENERAIPKIARRRDCISCGHCVSICKSKAIQHSDFPEALWLSKTP